MLKLIFKQSVLSYIQNLPQLHNIAILTCYFCYYGHCSLSAANLINQITEQTYPKPKIFQKVVLQPLFIHTKVFGVSFFQMKLMCNWANDYLHHMKYRVSYKSNAPKETYPAPPNDALQFQYVEGEGWTSKGKWQLQRFHKQKSNQVRTLYKQNET